MYSSTNQGGSRAPPPQPGQYGNYSTSRPSGNSNYSYMGSGGADGQPRRSSTDNNGQSSAFGGFNSFGFPSFNVQNLTQSFSNNFNPSNFSNFMSGQPQQQQTSAATSSSQRPPGTARSQSTSDAPEKYCEHCCTKFNYFKRRRTCIECNMDYCSNCFTSDVFLGTQSSRIGSGRQTCRKCRIFKLNPPDRHYLMSLKVKDLRWYIDNKGIPSQGCKEKSELVDSILAYRGYRPSHSYPNNPSSYRETSRSRRAAEDVLLRGQSLDEGGRGLGSPNRSSSSSPSSDASSWVLVEDDGGNNSNTTVGAVGGAAPTHSHPPPELLRPTVEVTSSGRTEVNQDANHDSGYLQQPVVSSSSGRESPSFYSGSPSRNDATDFKAFNIDDVQSEDQLQSLTVRQLKLILTRNFVDYKGCCEREELLEKVIRLWREKKAFKEQNPDEIPDENLCKICMEGPIDCVLLECGHMISCVNCGKRLAECPICRQYVVRVVRTFKS